MNRDEAILLARACVDESGWTWLEPVHASKRRRFIFFGRLIWQITTNAKSRGVNARVWIDDVTGEVIRKAYLPR